MILDIVRPENETEDLLTDNCETPIKQTHRKPEEILEFKPIKPKQRNILIQPNWRILDDWFDVSRIIQF